MKHLRVQSDMPVAAVNCTVAHQQVTAAQPDAALLCLLES